MKPQKVFLTADWKNLLMLNYVVDPSLLAQLVPPGTALHLFEGRTYLSLVGFEFNRVRLLGVPVPFHQAFGEVNLRFYVRRSSRGGVVFIREFAPKLAVSALARFAFNEKFSTVPVRHHIHCNPQNGIVEASYTWGSAERMYSMSIEADGPSLLPDQGSASHFITEHYWGYTAQPDGSSLEFEVRHPRWWIRNAKHAEISGNFAEIYGEKIAKALSGQPDSAFLVDGSPVTLFRGSKIN